MQLQVVWTAIAGSWIGSVALQACVHFFTQSSATCLPFTRAILMFFKVFFKSKDFF